MAGQVASVGGSSYCTLRSRSPERIIACGSIVRSNMLKKAAVNVPKGQDKTNANYSDWIATTVQASNRF